jgi:nitrite reductase/ring-hydroxylating ferredoxin subunit
MKIAAAKVGDIEEGKTHCVKLDNLKVLMTKVDGQIYAVENKCSHLGLSMEKGELENGIVTCPWHGSRFNVKNGENVDWVNSIKGHAIPEWSRKVISLGKAPAPITAYATVIDNDTVYILT